MTPFSSLLLVHIHMVIFLIRFFYLGVFISLSRMQIIHVSNEESSPWAKPLGHPPQQKLLIRIELHMDLNIQV